MASKLEATIILMKFTKTHIIGLIAAVAIIALDFALFFGKPLFLFLLGLGVVVFIIPFFINLLSESKREKEKNEQFLEFSRNLAESVKTGTPIGKSIIIMSTKEYGSLTPYVKKLANQISLGIPVNRALETFANDVDSNVVKRAVALIREAENAGGEIDYILESVAESINQIEKLKKERKNSISTLVVQGYIIFIIFIGIMLVMQFKILPLTAGISSVGSVGNLANAGSLENVEMTETTGPTPEALARPFLYLLLVQGFFAGLTIGKIAEGSLRSGIKHSIILVALAFLISTGATAFV